MTLRTNNEIKAGIIAKLKAESTITDVVNSDEIKEYNWQGREFVYPGIRVRVLTNNADNSNCLFSNISASILVYSELYSSLEADTIAGIIRTALHGKSFTSSGVAFTGIRVTNLVPAIRQDINTWRSEVLITGMTN